jgi:HAD superfamily hydrolase (TIGR01509 family)
VVVFDWGGTLMKVMAGYEGPMARWPKVRSMPGVRGALAKLPGHLTCCVATGAEDSDCELLAEALARVRIRHHFRDFMTPRELGAEKPSPDFYKAVAKHVGVRPGACVVVGDDLHRDVLPAKEAGMRTIWVTRLKVVERPAGVDGVIRHMKELNRAIGRLGK